MSRLNNSIKTHLIDPETFNSKRCEFRLRGLEAYLPNLRLYDVGYYDSQVQADSGLYYSKVTGLADVIARISLVHGNTVIDEISRETSQWLTLQTIKGRNTRANDIGRRLLKNGLAWDYARNGALSTFRGDMNDDDIAETAPRDYYNANDLTDFAQFHSQPQISASENEGDSGLLDLRMYLGFLSTVEMIKGIDDLKVVITWNSGSNAIYVQNTGANTQIANPNPLPKRPVLLVDEVIGLTEDQKKFEPVRYDRWLSERINVPAVAVGNEQQVTLRSQAFKDYLVKNLHFVNKVDQDRTDGAQVTMLKGNRLPAMFNERVQFVVNRVPLLPSTGINQEALKSALADDFFGPRHVPLASAVTSLRDPSGNVIDPDDASAVGNFSVGSVSVNDHINTMDVEYRRTGAAGNERAAAFQFLMFAECQHQLTMQGGRLRVTH